MSELGFITKISFGIFFCSPCLIESQQQVLLGRIHFSTLPESLEIIFPACWTSDGVVSAYILFSLDQNRINNINVTFFKKVLDTIYLKTRKAKCVRTRKEFRFSNLFRRIHINKLRM